MKYASIIIYVLGLFNVADASSFYVSQNAGTSGTGSFSNPWTLQNALDHPSALKPGDTVWLRGGTYSATHLIDASLGRISFLCKTNGTAGKPIIFRNYQNERVTLDGEKNQIILFVQSCSHTWFWGLEVMSSDTIRTPNRAYIYCTAPDVKFINMILHDCADGIDLWNAAKNAELYGCIIYHNGWDDASSGHGHGIYTQNDLSGIKKIYNNIFFSSYGNNIRLWSTNQGIDNYDIQRNILFNGGSCSEHPTARKHNFFIASNNPNRPIRNLTLKHNYTYAGITTTTGSCNNLGANYGSVNMKLDSNYFLGQLRLTAPFDSFYANGNKIYGGTALPYIATFGTIDWSLWWNTHFSQDIPTSGLEYFILPNEYEPDKSHIAIYNWDSASVVALNVGSAGLKPGDTYELIQVMDYFHDIDTGIVDDQGFIQVPMTGHTFANIIGSKKPPVSQFPKFGAFVLRKIADAIPTNTTESARKNKLYLYPNPASNKIIIHCDIKNGGLYHIQVYNNLGMSTGQTLQVFLNSGWQTLDLDCSQLENGFYILNLTGNGETLTRRFMINH